MGFDRNRNNPRKRFNPRRTEGNRAPFRKGSGEARRSQDNEEGPARRIGGRRDRDNEQTRRPIRGRRLIRKRNEKPLPKDKDELKHELDRQMREYWIKSGSGKGKDEAKKDSSLAIKKMNEEMDEYWKKAKEKK